MNATMKNLLLWTPRVLGMLFALFLSIFALDVFSEGYTVGETITALLIHLIPTFVLLIALALAWRWELAGAVIFFGFCTWYLTISWGQAPIVTLLLICGPPLLVGLLYLVDWFYRAELHPT